MEQCCSEYLSVIEDDTNICEKCNTIYYDFVFPLTSSHEITEYSHIDHIKDWIDRIQGMEDTEIPIALVSKVRKAKPNDLAELRTLLSGKYSRYHGNANKILYLAMGIRPSKICSSDRDDIIDVFGIIQEPYARHLNGKNLPSYQYILYKICQLLGFTYLLPIFRMFKTPKTIRAHDRVWKLVCLDLHWDYHPTPLTCNV